MKIYPSILDEGTEVSLVILAFEKEGTKPAGSDECATHILNPGASWRQRHESEGSPVATFTNADLLSTREGHILKLTADGLSNKEIARHLSIAPETVKSHVKNIFVKLNVENRAQAVSHGQASGLLGNPR